MNYCQRKLLMAVFFFFFVELLLYYCVDAIWTSYVITSQLRSCAHRQVRSRRKVQLLPIFFVYPCEMLVHHLIGHEFQPRGLPLHKQKEWNEWRHNIISIRLGQAIVIALSNLWIPVLFQDDGYVALHYKPIPNFKIGKKYCERKFWICI